MAGCALEACCRQGTAALPVPFRTQSACGVCRLLPSRRFRVQSRPKYHASLSTSRPGKRIRALRKVSRGVEVRTSKGGGATAVLEEQKPAEEHRAQDFASVFIRLPPRDWPPDGWYVSDEDLEKVYGGEEEWLEELQAKLQDEEYLEQIEGVGFRSEGETPADGQQEGQFKRWRAFLDQYHEWRAANKDRLDEEAEKDMEYMPGRRRVGKEMEVPTQDADIQGMYELPFIEEGQVYAGYISSVDLYCGAFVAFGGVHDGWVQIVREDWLKVRDYLTVGTKVVAEVTAKRDPYRFRFPVEMRLIDPFIDHLLEKKLPNPPIIGRPGDYDLDELMSEAGRPRILKRRPKLPKGYVEPKWQHVDVKKAYAKWSAEHLLVDREEYEAAVARGETPAVKPFDDPEDVDWENDDTSMVMEESELDLERARREKADLRKQKAEADAAGRTFEPKYVYEVEIDELSQMQEEYYAAMEEMEAKYTAERALLGLPPEEEPGFMDPETQAEQDALDDTYDKNNARFNPAWGTGFDPHVLQDAEATGRDPEQVFKQWEEDTITAYERAMAAKARNEKLAKSVEAEKEEERLNDPESRESVKRTTLLWYKKFQEDQEKAKEANRGYSNLSRGFERRKTKANMEEAKDLGDADEDLEEDVDTDVEAIEEVGPIVDEPDLVIADDIINVETEVSN